MRILISSVDVEGSSSRRIDTVRRCHSQSGRVRMRVLCRNRSAAIVLPLSEDRRDGCASSSGIYILGIERC
jgi:hypothetical protein